MSELKRISNERTSPSNDKTASDRGLVAPEQMSKKMCFPDCASGGALGDTYIGETPDPSGAGEETVASVGTSG